MVGLTRYSTGFQPAGLGLRRGNVYYLESGQPEQQGVGRVRYSAAMDAEFDLP